MSQSRNCLVLTNWTGHLETIAGALRALALTRRGGRGRRRESEPHLWTAGEIRRLLAVIDRQSAVGKRDYAMILLTARLGRSAYVSVTTESRDYSEVSDL